jgi:predicted acetyltransferase
MIKFTDNKDDIIKCWQEAFGDSEDEILYFINNAVNTKCLAFYEDNQITSMLYLVDCKVNKIDSKYIYAACTLNEYKNQGYMTQLLDFAKDNYKSICLIPAKNWLIDYYSKRGFTQTINISDITFNQIQMIKEYLFEGCELDNPIGLLYKYKGV